MVGKPDEVVKGADVKVSWPDSDDDADDRSDDNEDNDGKEEDDPMVDDKLVPGETVAVGVVPSPTDGAGTDTLGNKSPSTVKSAVTPADGTAGSPVKGEMVDSVRIEPTSSIT